MRARLALLCCALAAPAGAQPAVWLDAGAGRLGSGLVSSSGFVLNASTRLLLPGGELQADGGMARYLDGGADLAGRLTGTIRTPDRSGIRLEALGSAASARLRGYDPARRVELAVGGRAEGAGRAGRFLAGAARYRDREVWRTASRAEVEVAGEARGALATVTVSRTGFVEAVRAPRDTVYRVGGYEFRGTYLAEREVGRWYLDVSPAVHVPWRTLTLRGAAGYRIGTAQGATSLWASLTVAARLSRQSSLVAEAGRSPAVPEQLQPSRRFVSLAMRLHPRGPPPRPGLVRPAPPSSIELVPSAEGARTLRLRGVDGEAVELMADFTDWQAVPLRADGPGRWTLPRGVPAGTHRLSIRVDGGPWTPPPGLPRAADGFGGVVGVLVVDD